MLYLGVCRCQVEWPYGMVGLPPGQSPVLSYSVTVPPAVEPLTLAEVKLDRRVDHDLDDALLDGLIQAAREYCERYLGLSLITQTREAVMAAYPVDSPYASDLLPYGPVQSVESVAGDVAPYTVTYVAGFPPKDMGEDPPDLAGNVPASIKVAMKLMIGDWYENRENTVVGTSVGGTLALGVRALLDFYRKRLGIA